MPTQRNEDTNPLQPPDDETVRREINRSGSGGSGGAPEADPRVEGSGSESVDEMLAGHGPDDEATRPDEATAPADDASIARTSEPDARRTHVGWQILDRDGERLTRERSPTFRSDLSVPRSGMTPGPAGFP